MVIDVWSKQGTIVYATPAANKPKENNRPLLAILAEKQAGKLSELSEKELQKRIAALGE